MSEHPRIDRLDETAGNERVAMLDHVLRCPSCRAAVADRDPAGLFALLALRPLPGKILDEVSLGVRAGILRARPGAVSFREDLAGRVAPWAAALLLAAALGTAFIQRPGPPAAAPPPSASLAAVPAPLPARAEVEVLSSPGQAQVVDLTVGETQIVMIFDRGLPL